MNHFILFYNPIDKMYYTSDHTRVCDSCNIQLTDTIKLFLGWNKKKSIIQYLCLHCNSLQNSEVIEAKIVLVSPVISKEAYPVFFRPPQLGEGRVTTHWQAALLRSEGVDNDRTILSGRASWKGSLVGDTKYLEETDTRLLSSGEMDNILYDLQTSTHVIEDKETKKLEMRE